MLVPYSILVESLSSASSSSKDNVWDRLKSVPFSALIIAVGLQPIEKKIVMDSLLQTQRSGRGAF
jgi:hypothetical protein